MKKLYRVCFDGEIYVMADDEIDAECKAESFIKEECEYFQRISILADKKSFDDWKNSIPYNSDDDKTCIQILKENDK